MPASTESCVVDLAVRLPKAVPRSIFGYMIAIAALTSRSAGGIGESEKCWDCECAK